MTTKTIHKNDCARVFKRYDVTCPRCIELINGSTARPAWYSAQKTTIVLFEDCEHNNLNPAGYCNTCGNGRDFS